MLNIKLYQAGYASDLLRGVDTSRPWNLTKIISEKLNTQSTLLDIGCGDARKLISLTNHAHSIYGLEPSEAMRKLAFNKINGSRIDNIYLIAGKANCLPFENSSFDMVSCMLATWNSQEVHRVLKPGGWFVNETLGCEDKLEFKKAFGKDAKGRWRGQLMTLNNSAYIHQYEKDLIRQGFKDIQIINGFWTTYYTKQGLLELCKFTPTISEFDWAKDQSCFNNITQKLTTKNGIKIAQNRLLLIAQKPIAVVNISKSAHDLYAAF